MGQQVPEHYRRSTIFKTHLDEPYLPVKLDLTDLRSAIQIDCLKLLLSWNQHFVSTANAQRKYHRTLYYISARAFRIKNEFIIALNTTVNGLSWSKNYCFDVLDVESLTTHFQTQRIPVVQAGSAGFMISRLG
jgi:hypothetical protein